MGEPSPVQPPPPVALTRRERELAAAIRRGLSNREIAEEFRVSQQTVKNQLTALYAKLRVRGRLQLLIRVMAMD